MRAARKKTERYTYANYLTWPDSVRGELIHGVFYAVSPGPVKVHQSLALALGAQLRSQLKGKPCSVFVAPFDVRFAHEDADDGQVDTVVQPDVMVVCDKKKIEERGILGAPDFIIEVLSPATASKDHGEKRDLYEAHGVREYWLVHPTDQLVTIYTLTRRKKFSAARILPCVGSSVVSALAGVKVDWADAFSD